MLHSTPAQQKFGQGGFCPGLSPQIFEHVANPPKLRLQPKTDFLGTHWPPVEIIPYRALTWATHGRSDGSSECCTPLPAYLGSSPSKAMPVTRSAARQQEPTAAASRPPPKKAAPKPQQSERVVHTCPNFALHASLLLLSLPGAPEKPPFSGTWPDVMWPQSLCSAVLSVIASRVLPEGAFDDADPGRAFFSVPGTRCLLAIASGTPNMPSSVPAQAAFMQDAQWYMLKRPGDTRWLFSLPRPAKALLAGLDEDVVSHFQGNGSKAVLAARREEMQGILATGRVHSILRRHPVHRLLCWVHNGPPSRYGGKAAEGLLLQGVEGHNQACHTCPIESSLCMSTKHLGWGTAQDNALHRQHSRQKRNDRDTNNLPPGNGRV